LSAVGSLEGKIAVVCGASRGIGKGIAVELGMAGAHVVAAGRTDRPRSGSSAGSLEETMAQIKAAGGQGSAIRCDATDERSVRRLFESVGAERGRLDLLVNSVFDTQQFAPTIGLPFWELPMGAWDQIVGLGTRTAYLAAVAATPLLMRTGGLIVNVSGRGAERYRYNVAYGVGKAALDRMTRDMADELRAHNVAVVSIWPNVTRTENLERNPDRARTSYGNLDLLETPRYVGRAVAALAGDPAIMDRSGQRFWVAELGARYGFTDENGLEHPMPE
jgi:NAD(P)-dependent dehydrogenase (short-subunit alcohol dehydrogenase family)